jgi:hypothetical protein
VLAFARSVLDPFPDGRLYPDLRAHASRFGLWDSQCGAGDLQKAATA